MIKYCVFVRHGESTQNVAEQLGTNYDINNIKLTEKGKTQAEITGKFLKDVFNKFDVIYSSPIKRCIETANIIIKELTVNPDKLIEDSLLIESGEINHNLYNLSYDEKSIKNEKLSNLEEKISNVMNPFEQLKLSKQFYKLISDVYDIIPNYEQLLHNYKKFLKKVKNSPHKNILIIGHAGTLLGIQKIICGISLENDIIKFGISNDSSINKNVPIPTCSNCSIMCIQLTNNKFELVSPPNNSHLNPK
jgi:broad specificity phosphatase PhoE